MLLVVPQAVGIEIGSSVNIAPPNPNAFIHAAVQHDI
jgi:hypothetical protein